MTEIEQRDSLILLKSSQAVGKMVQAFKNILEAPAENKLTELAGITILVPEGASEIFRLSMHSRTIAAIAVETITDEGLIGNIQFRILKLDESIGEIFFTIRVRSNGLIEFPDMESKGVLDLHPANWDMFRRSTLLQIARAVQLHLPKMT